MRKLLLLVVPALLVACGSSNNNKKAVDRTFTPKATQAVLADSGAPLCDLNGAQFSANALAIELTTAGADPTGAASVACDDLKSPACMYHPASQSLELLLAHVTLNALPPVVPAPTVGRYDILANPNDARSQLLHDPQLSATIAFAQMAITGADPSCVPTTALKATSGTVTLDSVTLPTISGRVSLTFEDQSTFSSAFSASLLCPLRDVITSDEVCQRALAGGFCFAPACMPLP